MNIQKNAAVTAPRARGRRLRNGGTTLGSGKQSAQPQAQPALRGNETVPGRRDPATTVIYTMRQLGVAGLPRNYELFYEAITGNNKDLTDAISALGARPAQKDLDTVAHKFLARNDVWQLSEARDTVMDKLTEIMLLLKRDRSSLETYNKILGETSSGLSAQPPLSREFLDRIINVTATATRSSIDNRTQLASTIMDRSSELQQMKSTLEEYKRLAETDALTHLNNRRTFDRALTEIYDSSRGSTFGGLMLVDIDRFKTINDRFGHPVGDRVIQIVANLIKATSKEAAVVARTGGEEFAVIVEGLGEETLAKLADDIRQAVADAPFVNVATGTNYGPVTVSIGVCMASQANGPDELYGKADRALYASKAAGRNRVTRASHLEEGGLLKNWLIYRKD